MEIPVLVVALSAYNAKHRIGIYPGTFEPVHVGHVAFAEEAQQQCDLNKVLFLPELRPRGKSQVSDVSYRTALIQKMIENKADLGALRLDSIQFTVDETLSQLLELFPDARLTLLLGSDVMRGLARWPNVEELLKKMSLAIGMRTRDQQSDIAAMARKLEVKYHMSIEHDYIYTSYPHVASSQIRTKGDTSPTPLL